jgi:ribosomal protein L29
MKGVSARHMKNKSLEELNGELKKFKEELQTIRFSKVSGTAVSKLSKIKVSKNIFNIKKGFKKKHRQSLNSH